MPRILDAGIALSLLALAAAATAQAQKPSPAPAFEVLSIKHTGQLQDGGRNEGGRHYFRSQRGPEFRGVKLSGENTLELFLRFAFAPMVKPWRFEGPDWLKYNVEFYQIEAIAPAGATLDEARAMLRTALAARLGLQYHLVDRDTPVYALVRGTSELKLAPATGSDPGSVPGQMGAFKRKSATLADFAGFLSSLSDREVVDRTGNAARYQFDVDWSKEIQATMGEFGRHGDPAIVTGGLKKLGLKLEQRKESFKVMVVDKVNKEPTPN